MSIPEQRNFLARINSFFAKRYKTMQEQIDFGKNLPLDIANLQSIQRLSNNRNRECLISYDGQPTLAQYLLSTHNISHYDIATPQLTNRNMSRLSQDCLPQLIFLYEQGFDNYSAQRVKLQKSRGQQKEWKIKVRQSSLESESIITTLSQQQNHYCLMVVQTIGFIRINFERFSNLLDRNKQITINILSKLKHLPQFILESNVQYKNQIDALQKVIFRLFCLPGQEQILWPSLLLQPVFGSMQSVLKMIRNSYQQKTEGFANHQQIFEDTIKSYLINVMLMKLKPDTFKPTPQQQQLLNGISHISKGQTWHQQEFIIRLIGANATICQQQFFQWNEFNAEQLSLMMTKTPFEVLISDTNKTITRLNEYKKRQFSEIQNDSCLFKLCKYQIESSIEQFCIPIRYLSNAQENVLIRCLQLNQYPINQQFKWVSSHHLKVNQSLPKHNYQQRKFYNLFSNFTLQQSLSHIYSDFLGKKSVSFLNVMRIIYPLDELQKKMSKIENCEKCFYYFRKEDKYLCCKFCLKKYHPECDQRSKKNKKYAKNIYETENDNDLWTCQTCSPCRRCQTSITDLANAFRCMLCEDAYHINCGRFMDNRGEFLNSASYICENCLSCTICKNRLGRQSYFLEEQKVLCGTCASNLQIERCPQCTVSNQNERDMSLIKCTNTSCRAEIHRGCDQMVFGEGAPRINERQYRCYGCRRALKHRLIRQILDELRNFDELGFFDDPNFQEISGEAPIYKEPTCFNMMRLNILRGKYDRDTFEGICNDLRSIASHAMVFNMPRDDIHLKAKILQVVGESFMEAVRDLLGLSQLECMTKNPSLEGYKTQFYKELNRNYPEILINYGKRSSRIEVISNRLVDPTLTYFSSKDMLSKGMKNTHLKYHFQPRTPKIKQLFIVPKAIFGTWSKLKQDFCYYHPAERFPIIYQCPRCWQIYCCTKICYRHVYCHICRKNGCSCNYSRCGCQPLNITEFKRLEKEIKGILELNNITKLDYTQYHKYCLKCAFSKKRDCYICKKLCYFGYEQCKFCNSIYHLKCQENIKQQQHLGKLITNEKVLRLQYKQASRIRISNVCIKCTISNHQRSSLYRQKLVKENKEFGQRVKYIKSNLTIFQQIYEQEGIGMSHQDIINILLQNYDQFANLISIYQQKVIEQQQRQQMEHQQEDEDDVKQCLIDKFWKEEIKEKLNVINLNKFEYQNQMITYSKDARKQLAILQSQHQFAQLKAQASRYNFLMLDEIISHKIQLSAKNPQIFYCVFTDLLTTVTNLAVSRELYDDRHVSKDCFRGFKKLGQTILRKYIYFPEIPERWNYFEYNKNNFPSCKYILIPDFRSYQKETEEFISSAHEKRQKQQFLKRMRQLYKYFRYQYFQKNNQSKGIVVDQCYYPIFEPFLEIIPQPKLSNSLILDNRPKNPNKFIEDWIQNYLKSFALNALEQQKLVLRKGNTYLIQNDVQDWRICKKIANVRYFIHLFKDNGNWKIAINNNATTLPDILELLNVLRSLGCQVSTFEQIVDFLGLSIFGTSESIPRHFTNFLKKSQTYQLTPLHRMRRVLEIYDGHDWLDEGLVENKQTRLMKKMKKNSLYYLNKRGQQKKEDQSDRPFLSADDIRRQLYQNQLPPPQEEPSISINPINDTYIAPSKIDRLGLFISRDVERHTTIIEYIGEIIPEFVADERQKRNSDCYMFALDNPSDGNMNDREWGGKTIIDATYHGNKARYLNHSCDPNCKAKTIYTDGVGRIFIYTIKNVQKDEELTYDYQFKIESNEKLQCKCGADNCQGRLN